MFLRENRSTTSHGGPQDESRGLRLQLKMLRFSIKIEPTRGEGEQYERCFREGLSRTTHTGGSQVPSHADESDDFVLNGAERERGNIARVVHLREDNPNHMGGGRARALNYG